jgi:hypothetical protein
MDSLRKDLRIYWFIAAYAALGFGLAISVGRPDKFAPFVYAGHLVVYLLIGSAGWLAWRGVRNAHLLRGDSRSWRRQIIPPTFIADVLLAVLLVIFMGVFTSIKSLLPNLVPFQHDRFLADLDLWIHGVDPWRIFDAVRSERLTIVVERLYSQLWGVFLLGFTAVTMMAPGLRAVRSRFAWTYLLSWVLLGNIAALLGMSAGPCYFEFITGDPRFKPLTDHLAQSGGMASQTMAALWVSYQNDQVTLASGISAFPSMHLAMATLFMLTAMSVSRLMGIIFALYLVVVMCGSVYLGWHYAVDGYFSIVATAGLWYALGWALRSGKVDSPKAASLGEAAKSA